METNRSSQNSYSTPRSRSSRASDSLSKSASATSRKSSNENSRSGMTEQNDYSHTFQSSSHSARPPSASPDQIKNSSVNMNDTGESTRSLLSVLSHSSVDSLSSGSLTHSSTTSSPARLGTDSQQNNQHTETSANQRAANGQEPVLTPWEKWLIEKAKLERKKVREEVQRKLAELKAKEDQEERNKERRRHIEGEVVDWLREKEKEEKKRRSKEDRKKRLEQKEKNLLKQKLIEKDKVERQEWLLKKKKEENMLREKAQEEKQRRALEERMRKEKADEAFQKWKKQAKYRPKPDTGSFYHQGNIRGGLHSAPSYCNPVPWMPTETPSGSKPAKHSRSSAKRKNKKTREDQIVQSPPLLFKDRSNTETFKRWGRPR